MTRPASYTDQLPTKRCETCRHCLHHCQIGLACVYGDDVKFGQHGLPVGANGIDFDLMSGQQLRTWLATRSVKADAVCDEWEQNVNP